LDDLRSAGDSLEGVQKVLEEVEAKLATLQQRS
jgi:hypothetical protein